jgi:hypothetical protein
MKTKETSNTSENPVEKVNSLLSAEKQTDQVQDPMAANERDSGKVKAVDGNPAA